MATPPVVPRLRRHIPFLALAVLLGASISGATPALSALPTGSSVATASMWGTTFTVQRPSTATAGDVPVALVNARLSGDAAITAPSGWNLIRRDSSSPGSRPLTQALYYKVAGSGEPAGYGWTLASASSATGAILDFNPAGPTKP